MDNATSQQAVEILRMVYQKTQQGNVVSFSKDMGKGLMISINDCHDHATWRTLQGDNENENLEIIIHGLYDKLVYDANTRRIV